MKLLFVHQNLGALGGAETFVHLTATELRARGHEPGMLFRSSTGKDEVLWRQTFGHCFKLPGQANTEFAEAMLDSFRPELIFLHSFEDLDVIETLLRSGVPVVRMVHDHALYCMRTYKYNYFTRKICTRAASAYCVFPCLASMGRTPAKPLGLKWVSYSEKQRELELNKRTAAVCVYSEYQKDELVRNGFASEKIFLTRPMRTQSDRGLTSSFSSENVILFAGQIIRGKGVDALLCALAKVQVPFQCIILGEGNHRGYCERLCVRLGLQDRVRFEGYVAPAELKRYYLKASVFAVSSLWPEPFGMSGPEAMRYGLPVVAFDAGAIREWLHDGRNGFLVPWNDARQFAQRLETLLRDKDLGRRMGRQGLESIQRFDVSCQIPELENLFFRVRKQTRTVRSEPIEISNLSNAYD